MRDLTVFPLPGGTYYKSSGYGPRTNPVTGKAGTFHRGVDYAAPTGTPIYAPFDGNITTGFEAGGAGNWTNLQNATDLFKSFHQSAYAVRSGFVRAGDVIAYIGTTGSSTGPHAHFELWEAGRNIDPTPWLDRAPLQGARIETLVRGLKEENVKIQVMASKTAQWLVWGIFKAALASQAEVDRAIFWGAEDARKVLSVEAMEGILSLKVTEELGRL